jgi:hypothetical protein
MMDQRAIPPARAGRPCCHGSRRGCLRHVSADRLVPAPDCGMKYLSRQTAFGKLGALAAGAALARRGLT